MRVDAHRRHRTHTPPPPSPSGSDAHSHGLTDEEADLAGISDISSLSDDEDRMSSIPDSIDGHSSNGRALSDIEHGGLAGDDSDYENITESMLMSRVEEVNPTMTDSSGDRAGVTQDTPLSSRTLHKATSSRSTITAMDLSYPDPVTLVDATAPAAGEVSQMLPDARPVVAISTDVPRKYLDDSVLDGFSIIEDSEDTLKRPTDIALQKLVSVVESVGGAAEQAPCTEMTTRTEVIKQTVKVTEPDADTLKAQRERENARIAVQAWQNFKSANKWPPLLTCGLVGLVLGLASVSYSVETSRIWQSTKIHTPAVMTTETLSPVSIDIITQIATRAKAEHLGLMTVQTVSVHAVAAGQTSTANKVPGETASSTSTSALLAPTALRPTGKQRWLRSAAMTDFDSPSFPLCDLVNARVTGCPCVRRPSAYKGRDGTRYIPSPTPLLLSDRRGRRHLEIGSSCHRPCNGSITNQRKRFTGDGFTFMREESSHIMERQRHRARALLKRVRHHLPKTLAVRGTKFDLSLHRIEHHLPFARLQCSQRPSDRSHRQCLRRKVEGLNASLTSKRKLCRKGGCVQSAIERSRPQAAAAFMSADTRVDSGSRCVTESALQSDLPTKPRQWDSTALQMHHFRDWITVLFADWLRYLPSHFLTDVIASRDRINAGMDALRTATNEVTAQLYTELLQAKQDLLLRKMRTKGAVKAHVQTMKRKVIKVRNSKRIRSLRAKARSFVRKIHDAI